MAGLPKKHHLRTSLILAAFEAGMPAVGVLIGHGLGEFFGHFAGYTAAAVIALAGLIMLRKESTEKKEKRRMRLLKHAKGITILDLGLSISLDELAIGLSLGLLGISLWLAALMLGIQAFFASQMGFYLGKRLNDRLRESAEKLAGMILIVLAVVLIAIKLTGNQI